MTTARDGQSFLQFANEIGYDIGERMAQNIEMQFQKNFNFLPEFALFIASYKVKKTFSRPTTPPKHIQNSIRFFFHNAFDDDGPTKGKRNLKSQEKPPYVRVFPSELPHTSIFRKNSHVKVVSVFISADYLKSFLKDDVEHFPFLFDNGNNFLIEEMMTDDILRTINDIAKKEEPDALNSYLLQTKNNGTTFLFVSKFEQAGKSCSSKTKQ